MLKEGGGGGIIFELISPYLAESPVIMDLCCTLFKVKKVLRLIIVVRIEVAGALRTQQYVLRPHSSRRPSDLIAVVLRPYISTMVRPSGRHGRSSMS